METITVEMIRKLSPCYDPTEYLNEDWQGTVVDILKIKECPAIDRLWVATHFIDDKTMRLFAVWCAREALKLVDSPDEMSIAACDVAERYANGDASREELDAARVAAWHAARAAWHAAIKKQIEKLIEMVENEGL